MKRVKDKIGFVLILLFVFCFGLSVKASFGCKGHVALITGIINGVTVVRSGKPLDGNVRMCLYEWDIVTTGPGQKCVILLSDDSEIKLNENTTLVLEEIALLKFKKKKTVLNMLFGEIFFKVSKSRERQFEVKAGKAVAAIEGTTFDLRCPKEEKFSQLTVVDGKVRYHNLDRLVRYDNLKKLDGKHIPNLDRYRPNDMKDIRIPNDVQSPTTVLVLPNYMYIYKYRQKYHQNTSDPTSVDKPIFVQNLETIVGWNKHIQKYLERIKEMLELCNQLIYATRAREGAMPKDLTDKLNDSIIEFDRIKHDSDFDRGHNAIKTAFINFRRCAAGFPESCGDAQKYYNEGVSELLKYEPKFIASEELLRLQYK